MPMKDPRRGQRAAALFGAGLSGAVVVIGRILAELDALLTRDGHATLASAVGTGRDRWL